MGPKNRRPPAGCPRGGGGKIGDPAKAEGPGSGWIAIASPFGFGKNQRSRPARQVPKGARRPGRAASFHSDRRPRVNPGNSGGTALKQHRGRKLGGVNLRRFSTTVRGLRREIRVRTIPRIDGGDCGIGEHLRHNMVRWCAAVSEVFDRREYFAARCGPRASATAPAAAGALFVSSRRGRRAGRQRAGPRKKTATVIIKYRGQARVESLPSDLCAA